MTTARVLKVVDFDVGMSIEAEYENPRDNTGSLHLNLRKDEDNYVLHFNPRWGQNKLVINSKEDGTFGNQESAGGYDFAPGAKVTVKFFAESEFLKIHVNGKQIHQFNYRGLKCDSISDISYKWEGDPARAGPLIALRIGYQ